MFLKQQTHIKGAKDCIVVSHFDKEDGSSFKMKYRNSHYRFNISRGTDKETNSLHDTHNYTPMKCAHSTANVTVTTFTINRYTNTHINLQQLKIRVLQSMPTVN